MALDPSTAKCPNCKRLLKAHAIGHCRNAGRKTPCGWVVCECKTVIDKMGNFMPRPKGIK